MCLCAGRGTPDGSNFQRLLHSAHDGVLDLAVLEAVRNDGSLTPQGTMKEIQGIWRQVRADTSKRLPPREVLDLCSFVVWSSEALRGGTGELAGGLTGELLKAATSADAAKGGAQGAHADRVLRQTLALWAGIYRPKDASKKDAALKQRAESCAREGEEEGRLAVEVAREKMRMVALAPRLLPCLLPLHDDALPVAAAVVRVALAEHQLPGLVLQALPRGGGAWEESLVRFETLVKAVLHTVGSEFVTHVRAARAKVLGGMPTLRSVNPKREPEKASAFASQYAQALGQSAAELLDACGQLPDNSSRGGFAVLRAVVHALLSAPGAERPGDPGEGLSAHEWCAFEFLRVALLDHARAPQKPKGAADLNARVLHSLVLSAQGPAAHWAGAGAGEAPPWRGEEDLQLPEAHLGAARQAGEGARAGTRALLRQLALLGDGAGREAVLGEANSFASLALVHRQASRDCEATLAAIGFAASVVPGLLELTAPRWLGPRPAPSLEHVQLAFEAQLLQGTQRARRRDVAAAIEQLLGPTWAEEDHGWMQDFLRRLNETVPGAGSELTWHQLSTLYNQAQPPRPASPSVALTVAPRDHTHEEEGEEVQTEDAPRILVAARAQQQQEEEEDEMEEDLGLGPVVVGAMDATSDDDSDGTPRRGQRGLAREALAEAGRPGAGAPPEVEGAAGGVQEQEPRQQLQQLSMFGEDSLTDSGGAPLTPRSASGDVAEAAQALPADQSSPPPTARPREPGPGQETPPAAAGPASGDASGLWAAPAGLWPPSQPPPAAAESPRQLTPAESPALPAASDGPLALAPAEGTDDSLGRLHSSAAASPGPAQLLGTPPQAGHFASRGAPEGAPPSWDAVHRQAPGLAPAGHAADEGPPAVGGLDQLGHGSVPPTATLLAGGATSEESSPPLQLGTEASNTSGSSALLQQDHQQQRQQQLEEGSPLPQQGAGDTTAATLLLQEPHEGSQGEPLGRWPMAVAASPVDGAPVQRLEHLPAAAAVSAISEQHCTPGQSDPHGGTPWPSKAELGELQRRPPPAEDHQGFVAGGVGSPVDSVGALAPAALLAEGDSPRSAGTMLTEAGGESRPRVPTMEALLWAQQWMRFPAAAQEQSLLGLLPDSPPAAALPPPAQPAGPALGDGHQGALLEADLSGRTSEGSAWTPDSPGGQGPGAEGRLGRGGGRPARAEASAERRRACGAGGASEASASGSEGPSGSGSRAEASAAEAGGGLGPAEASAAGAGGQPPHPQADGRGGPFAPGWRPGYHEAAAAHAWRSYWSQVQGAPHAWGAAAAQGPAAARAVPQAVGHAVPAPGARAAPQAVVHRALPHHAVHPAACAAPHPQAWHAAAPVWWQSAPQYARAVQVVQQVAVAPPQPQPFAAAQAPGPTAPAQAATPAGDATAAASAQAEAPGPVAPRAEGAQAWEDALRGALPAALERILREALAPGLRGPGAEAEPTAPAASAAEPAGLGGAARAAEAPPAAPAAAARPPAAAGSPERRRRHRRPPVDEEDEDDSSDCSSDCSAGPARRRPRRRSGRRLQAVEAEASRAEARAVISEFRSASQALAGEMKFAAQALGMLQRMQISSSAPSRREPPHVPPVTLAASRPDDHNDDLPLLDAPAKDAVSPSAGCGTGGRGGGCGRGGAAAADPRSHWPPLGRGDPRSGPGPPAPWRDSFDVPAALDLALPPAPEADGAGGDPWVSLHLSAHDWELGGSAAEPRAGLRSRGAGAALPPPTLGTAASAGSSGLRGVAPPGPRWLDAGPPPGGQLAPTYNGFALLAGDRSLARSGLCPLPGRALLGPDGLRRGRQPSAPKAQQRRAEAVKGQMAALDARLRDLSAQFERCGQPAK
ncbi:unnamed protein product [Prorocentrum cordatum]|uniref:Uncharacterized protein n=1 Tax=Prorocentrum cordatum TaxID=2364126 RepID=A0ABN9SCZ2_9DINO|nr:unnamed protein product [Polarella glacialis]